MSLDSSTQMDSGSWLMLFPPYSKDFLTQAELNLWAALLVFWFLQDYEAKDQNIPHSPGDHVKHSTE